MNAFVPKFRNCLREYHKLSYIKESVPENLLFDCALGVNPFGHSPKISASNLEKLDFSYYPGYPYLPLREAIAKHWSPVAKLGAGDIRLGNGSVGLLDMLCKCLIDEGSRVLGFMPQFTDFRACVLSYGGIYDYVSMDVRGNGAFDISVLGDAITSDHTLVYIDNPNNPTGQVFGLDVIAHLARKAREKGALLFVDEAYGEYMDLSASALSLIHEFDNLCVIRTFSKGFGLADLRVGYVIAPEPLLNCYDNAGLPFMVGQWSVALAQIALSDMAFISESRKSIAAVKQAIISSLTKFRALHTNNDVPIFTMVSPAPGSLYKTLLQNGVMCEDGADFIGLGDSAVRMRVPMESERLISILNEIQSGL